jgi:hypothetical protein
MQEGLQSKPRQLELPGLDAPLERLVTAKISREPEQSDIRSKAAAYLLQANPLIYPPNKWLLHHVSNELKTLRDLLAPQQELIEFAKRCVSKRLELLYPTGEVVRKSTGASLSASETVKLAYSNQFVEKAFAAIVTPDTFKKLWDSEGAKDSVARGVSRDRWNNTPQERRQAAFQKILDAAFKILENDPKLNPSKLNDSQAANHK